MSTDSPLSPLETGALGFVGVLVTALVAFVPSLSPLQETLTTLLGSTVTFGFMIAAAIHAHGVKTAPLPTPVAPAPLAVVPPPAS